MARLQCDTGMGADIPIADGSNCETKMNVYKDFDQADDQELPIAHMLSQASTAASFDSLLFGNSSWDSLPFLRSATIDSLAALDNDEDMPDYETDFDHWGLDAIRHFGYSVHEILGTFGTANARFGKPRECDGTSGVLRRAVRRADGKEVLMKVVASPAGELPAPAMNTVLKEFRVLRTLRHESVVRVAGLLRTRFECWLVVDGLVAPSMQAGIDKFGAFASPVAMALFVQLLRGLAYLHDVGVIHNDVKPASLLVDRAGKQLQISNFASASRAAVGVDAEPAASQPGTAESVAASAGRTYNAPEQLFYRTWDERADVWAAGLTFYFSMWACLPFNILESAVAAVILAGRLPAVDAPKSAPPSLGVVKACLAIDAGARPSAADLLRHPLLAKMCGGWTPGRTDAWSDPRAP